jgi:hypothetical protein
MYKIKKRGEKMEKMQVFPLEVFVWWETEEGSEDMFLIVSENIEHAVNVGDSKDVAVYELKEKRKVRGIVMTEPIKP